MIIIMEKEIIIEGNKLIVEFMGEQIIMEDSPSHTKVTSTKAYLEHEYSYHMRWDWLMPVVEKILKENMSCCTYGAPQYCSGQEGWYFTMLDDQKNCQQAEGDTMLKATYEAVVNHLKQKE